MIRGLRTAEAADLPALLDLLRNAGLPIDDLSAGSLEGFFVAGGPPGNPLVEAGALEVHGTEGLLRSLAVAPGFAHAGIGTAITQRLIYRADAIGLRRTWLLTLTAEDFFPRFGFRTTDRRLAPAAVSATAEFQRLCPGSAICMVRAAPTA
jgi:N-acetylglutamate synthase-like GNAT family acetyltransferase